VTEHRESCRQIRRERRLADAPLSARHREDAGLRVHRDPGRALGDASAQPRGERALLLRRHDVEGQRDLLHTLERKQRAVDLFLKARPERTAGDREGDRHADALALDGYVAHHVELDDGTAELGVDHALERAQDLVSRGRHRT
jgi:uncharacterized protein RhaS with RHS repeats